MAKPKKTSQNLLYKLKQGPKLEMKLWREEESTKLYRVNELMERERERERTPKKWRIQSRDSI